MRFFYLSCIFAIFLFLNACGDLEKNKTSSKEHMEILVENTPVTDEEDIEVIEENEISVEIAPVTEEEDIEVTEENEIPGEIAPITEEEDIEVTEENEILVEIAPVTEEEDIEVEVTEENEISVEMTPVAEGEDTAEGRGDTEVTEQNEPENNSVSYACTKGSQTKTYVLYEYPERNSEGFLCYLDLPGNHYYNARNEIDFCKKKLDQALQRNQQRGFICSNN